jgi:hypothetical protein
LDARVALETRLSIRYRIDVGFHTGYLVDIQVEEVVINKFSKKCGNYC